MATDKMSDGGPMVLWGTNDKIFTDKVLTEAPEPLSDVGVSYINLLISLVK